MSMVSLFFGWMLATNILGKTLLPFFLPQEIYCPWGRYIHVPVVWNFWEDGDVIGTK